MRNYLYRVVTGEEQTIAAILLRWPLWVLSYVYSAGVFLKNFVYDIELIKPYAFRQPVISVGNVTLGGVGKTPLVEFIAGYIIQELKLKPVILMRGYMPKNGSESDEAMMLREHLPSVPVIVGANRIECANEFLKTNQADVFIMDDGFQHRQIKRNLNILVIDATNPYGNGAVLPAGILREPFSSVERADIIVITRIDLVSDFGQAVISEIKKFSPKTPIARVTYEPVRLLNLRAQQYIETVDVFPKLLVAASSIGNPLAFKKTIINKGGQLIQLFEFPDHHDYVKEDIDIINSFCQEKNITNLITTEKDAVKLKKIISWFHPTIEVYSLQMRLSFATEEGTFCARIRSVLSR